MDIIVCIKQVPDTTDVKIDPKTNTLIREGIPCRINPFDENAIEESLRLKERYGGKVTVITMGPLQAIEALKDAYAMGSDEVILISDKNFAGSDTYATSYILSTAIKKIGKYDLILCGKQAIDGDTAQVGPGIAEHLGIPQITYVRKIIEMTDTSIIVERATETGYEKVKAELPVLLTVLKEINVPRYPSLKGKIMAKRLQIPVWGLNDLGCDTSKIGLEGSPTQVIKIFTPPKKTGGEILGGDTETVINTLIHKLQAHKII